MDEPAILICQHCSKEFQPTAPHQVYCSTNCRVAAWQQRTRGSYVLAGDARTLLVRMGLEWITRTLDTPENRVPLDERESLSKRPTWRELTKWEPRLLLLYHLARATYDDLAKDHFCANWVWVKFYKPLVSSLVGWSAVCPPHPALTTSQAYDVAYEKIYDQLPGCRNCACL